MFDHFSAFSEAAEYQFSISFSESILIDSEKDIENSDSEKDTRSLSAERACLCGHTHTHSLTLLFSFSFFLSIYLFLICITPCKAVKNTKPHGVTEQGRIRKRTINNEGGREKSNQENIYSDLHCI